MKNYLYLLINFLCLSTMNAQQSPDGTWISKNIMTLNISGDSINFINKEKLSFRVSNDTAFVTQHIKFQSFEDYDTFRVHIFKMSVSGDTLTLKALDNWAEDWLETAGGMSFMTVSETPWVKKHIYIIEKKAKKIWLNRKNIELEKLVFIHPWDEVDQIFYKLEINKNRDIYLQGKIDSSISNYYKFNGDFNTKLSKTEFSKLKKLLINSALERIDRNWGFNGGGPYMLIVDENGIAEYGGYNIPPVCNDLIKYLDKIFLRLDWEKMEKPHTFFSAPKTEGDY